MSLPSGIVAWWPGDGSAAALVGPAGTLNGAAFEPGRVGQAFAFDGGTDYVSTELDVQPSALPETTWETWVYPTRVSHPSRQQILSHDSGGYGRSVLIEGGTSNFGIFTGSGVWQPTTVSLNQWQHIAVVFTSTNILFYKDGVEFSYGQAPALRSSVHSLQIGRNPGYGEYFQGLIDEVSIYNRALRPDEVQAIFTAGEAGKCKAVGTADLSLILHTEPLQAGIGENITNTVLLTNLGPDPALIVSVAYGLPPGTSLVSYETNVGAWSVVGDQFSCSVGDLPASEMVSLRVVTKAKTEGQKTNTVVAGSLSADPNLANNQASQLVYVLRYYTSQDGDWDATHQMLYDTPEAALMARTGDIDNLGFGWPANFDPFSGSSTPGHAFPWAASTNDPAGTDRIMVISSYDGHPPHGQDGYTGSTSRPANAVQMIEINYDLAGMPVSSAALQLFVDDFQAPVWGASYEVTLNGTRAPFLETIINALAQTGPVGKLISANLPAEYLPLLQSNRLAIIIDDNTTGAGDGYAIDFAKLLINVKAFGQVGTIEGSVVDSINQQPIPGVRLWAGGYVATTDLTGRYLLPTVPAGLALVEATHPDYVRQTQSTDLLTGQTNIVNFSLSVQPRLRIDLIGGLAVVSWPGSLAGYTLQATHSLAAPVAWLPEGTTPAVVNGRFTITNTIEFPATFYRLVKP